MHVPYIYCIITSYWQSKFLPLEMPIFKEKIIRRFGSAWNGFSKKPNSHTKSIKIEFHIIMFENKQNLLDDHFEIEKRTKFREGLLNRKCYFKTAILDLMDAVF